MRGREGGGIRNAASPDCQPLRSQSNATRAPIRGRRQPPATLAEEHNYNVKGAERRPLIFGAPSDFDIAKSYLCRGY